MKILKHIIFLLLFLAIGLVGKVSAEDGNQLCYPGYNITLSHADSKFLNLKSKNIRKPILEFMAVFSHHSPPLSDLLFGQPKMPETNAHCHPLTEELSNLLMNEYQFSWMNIVSDVQMIDGNPWWCKDYGLLNPSKPFDENMDVTHVCYPKYWTDGIGKYMCDLQHWDQMILR